jgi:formylglycine-generating enzyme required for sulfatase activity
MDVHEVTNQIYDDFVEATGYVTVAERPLEPEDYPGERSGRSNVGRRGRREQEGEREEEGQRSREEWRNWIRGKSILFVEVKREKRKVMGRMEGR